MNIPKTIVERAANLDDMGVVGLSEFTDLPGKRGSRLGELLFEGGTGLCQGLGAVSCFGSDPFLDRFAIDRQFLIDLLDDLVAMGGGLLSQELELLLGLEATGLDGMD